MAEEKFEGHTAPLFTKSLSLPFIVDALERHDADRLIRAESEVANTVSDVACVLSMLADFSDAVEHDPSVVCASVEFGMGSAMRLLSGVLAVCNAASEAAAEERRVATLRDREGLKCVQSQT